MRHREERKSFRLVNGLNTKPFKSVGLPISDFRTFVYKTVELSVLSQNKMRFHNNDVVIGSKKPTRKRLCRIDKQSGQNKKPFFPFHFHHHHIQEKKNVILSIHTHRGMS